MTVANRRTFKRGDCLRTMFIGRTDEQIFRLREPVSNGSKHGGHWRVTWLVGHYDSVVQIDDLPRVSRSELKRRRLR